MNDRAARSHADPRRLVDPRAIRVSAPDVDPVIGGAAIVVEPAALPVAPAQHGSRLDAPPSLDLSLETGRDDALQPVIVDGEPVLTSLEGRTGLHATLVESEASGERTRVLLFAEEPAPGGRGAIRREVVVDGWRVEVELESERRAALRERARRGHEAVAHGGPTEVRAIIPGRVLSVSVADGDTVVAGQQLLVVEAMKMQNELRAPRDGTVARVVVGAGRTIEVGDVLVVLE